jgi:hypothetical protein
MQIDSNFAFLLLLPVIAAGIVLAIFYVGYAIVVRDE